jgi:hypothetical protein
MEKLSYKVQTLNVQNKEGLGFSLSSSCPSFSPFSPLQLVSVEPPVRWNLHPPPLRPVTGLMVW